jgi:hypothetical protein
MLPHDSLSGTIAAGVILTLLLVALARMLADGTS